MTVSMCRLDAPLGVEFEGVDLSQDTDEATLEQILTAWNNWSVVVFRNQHLTPEQLIGFTKNFGELEIHVLDQYLHPRHPEILVVSNIKENDRHVGIYDAGRYWHSDLSYMAEPSRGSILYAIEIPEQDGNPLGDTLWASNAAAYDALPDDLARRIDGMRAAFSLEHRHERLKQDGDVDADLRADQRTKVPEVVHPVVRTHPATGHKGLFVNEGHTVRILDIPAQESANLLQKLCRHCTAPEFIYRHRWRVGDVVMWDNIPTQHLAICDYALPQRRLLHRTTLRGGAPAYSEPKNGIEETVR
jgi:taurine dioxygenase